MTTKQMNVKSTGFHPGDLSVKKNQDSVHFIQSGPNAPATVTISSAALFGTTTCTVDANDQGPNVYHILPTAPDGNYTVNLPAMLALDKNPGTIQVTG